MPTHTHDRTLRIQSLNDCFRQSMSGGRVLATRGVLQFSQTSFLQLMQRVRSYNQFDGDNDPYGEHAFGVIEHNGQRVFWKIDYYDAAYNYGSPDPADAAATGRILTIMLAEEW